MESDFFIRSATSLIPVEVKAKSGRAKSMKTLIASDHYPDIRYGFKLSKNNIVHENKIYTFPYFCSFLLKRFMSGFQAEEEAEYDKPVILNGSTYIDREFGHHYAVNKHGLVSAEDKEEVFTRLKNWLNN